MLLNTIREKRGLKKNHIALRCTRNHLGITEQIMFTEIIISLTSHPGRIKHVDKTIITLLNQTVKPNHVILWLAEEQFPRKEESLPSKLVKLKEHGLEIMWCKDIKSYKKLIPSLQSFPSATIITVDDDMYYRNEMLESLLNEHRIHPKDIISSEVTHPFFNEQGKLVSRKCDSLQDGTVSFFNKMLGGTGTLYPVNSLFSDVCNEKLFMSLAPTNDDIWFWAMAVKNNTRIRVPQNPVHPFGMTSPNYQYETSLAKINESQNLYLEATNNIFTKYPEIEKKLKSIKE